MKNKNKQKINTRKFTSLISLIFIILAFSMPTYAVSYGELKSVMQQLIFEQINTPLNYTNTTTLNLTATMELITTFETITPTNDDIDLTSIPTLEFSQKPFSEVFDEVVADLEKKEIILIPIETPVETPVEENIAPENPEGVILSFNNSNTTNSSNNTALVFYSNPSNANVYLDSTYWGVTPIRIITSPGIHYYSVQKLGYSTYYGSIYLNANEIIPINAQLAINHTNITFQQNNTNNTYYNNTYYNNTHFNNTNNISNVSTPTGEVLFSSTPQGATVILDGVERGLTPLTLSQISVGYHYYTFQKAGYVSVSSYVRVYANQIIPLNITLTANQTPSNNLTNVSFGWVKFYSYPPEAYLILDGEFLGTTPKSIEKVAVGSHYYMLQKQGYIPNAGYINVYQNRGTLVNVTLTLNQTNTSNFNNTQNNSQYGPAYFKTTPPQAAVYLNGNYAGQTPLYLPNYPIGKYGYTITKTGYATVYGIINIYAKSSPPIINVNLTPNNTGVIFYKTIPGEGELSVELENENGTLNISSNPTGAKVFINGVEKGTTPFKMELPAGDYLYSLQKTGYITKSAHVNIYTNDVTPLDIVLELNPTPPPNPNQYGNITINSTPRPAVVLFDNQPEGITPLTKNNIPVGLHKIQITLPGFYSYNETLNITPNVHITRHIVLTQNTSTTPPPTQYGNVTINSTPIEAIVLLDGNYEGLTPITIRNVPVGRHAYTLFKRGYNITNGTIIISSNEKLQLHIILKENKTTPPPTQYGSIVFYSNPYPAIVEFDNQGVGNTYLSMSNIPVGTHTYAIKKEGYITNQSTVTIFPNVETVINVNLIKNAPPLEYGTLEFTSNPKALLYLDGVQKIETPVIFEDISAGTHYYELVKGGYEIKSGYTIVSAGKTTIQNVILTPIAPPAPLEPTCKIHSQNGNQVILNLSKGNCYHFIWTPFPNYPSVYEGFSNVQSRLITVNLPSPGTYNLEPYTLCGASNTKTVMPCPPVTVHNNIPSGELDFECQASTPNLGFFNVVTYSANVISGTPPFNYNYQFLFDGTSSTNPAVYKYYTPNRDASDVAYGRWFATLTMSDGSGKSETRACPAYSIYGGPTEWGSTNPTRLNLPGYTPIGSGTCVAGVTEAFVGGELKYKLSSTGGVGPKGYILYTHNLGKYKTYFSSTGDFSIPVTKAGEYVVFGIAYDQLKWATSEQGTMTLNCPPAVVRNNIQATCKLNDKTTSGSGIRPYNASFTVDVSGGETPYTVVYLLTPPNANEEYRYGPYYNPPYKFTGGYPAGTTKVRAEITDATWVSKKIVSCPDVIVSPHPDDDISKFYCSYGTYGMGGTVTYDKLYTYGVVLPGSAPLYYGYPWHYTYTWNIEGVDRTNTLLTPDEKARDLYLNDRFLKYNHTSKGVKNTYVIIKNTLSGATRKIDCPIEIK